jgi:hypothetical protein
MVSFRSSRTPDIAVDVFLAGALAALAWAVYHRATSLWLTYDDFFHLHYLYTTTPAQYLLVPEVWQRLPFKMITPLLFLSFDLDLALAGGLDAHAFFLHQLVSFALCVAAFYGVLRLWLPRSWAALGAVLFLIGPPITGAAPLLMVRHYLETTLLGLLAVAAWVIAVRRGGRGGWQSAALSIVSALLALAAMLAKEIAVPLPLFLPLLPEGTLRQRLRLAVPHAIALAVYLAYRIYMLGTLGGGYGFVAGLADLPRLAFELPGKMAAQLEGEPSFASRAMLAALLAGSVMVLLRGRGARVRLGFGALAALLPILPVSTEMVPRYAIPAWIVLAVAFPFGVRVLAEQGGAARLAGIGLALIALAGTLAVHLDVREETFARLERISAENRAFLGFRPGDYLRHPLGPPASMGELTWIRENVLHRGTGGGWFYDDLFLCRHAAEVRRLWSYDPVARRVEDVTATAPALRRRYCAAIRWRAPLSLEIQASGTGGPSELFWTLGPYRDGRYTFLMGGEGTHAVDMPASGGFRLKKLSRIDLRVRYESPAGWVTYSPELILDFDRARSFRWSRPPGRR